MKRIAIILLIAGAMLGEAGILHDDEAALLVGHTMVNRVEAGFTWEQIAAAYFGYDPAIVAPDEYVRLAEQVLGRETDPIDGAIYIYSHQDLSVLVDEPACIRQLALRQSRFRIIDGVFYRLYVYNRPVQEINPYAAAMCDPRR